MNKVEELAKLLEVDLNKEFKVIDSYGNITCRAILNADNGLNIIEFFLFPKDTPQGVVAYLVLNGLILGEYYIVKPFIPYRGKTYYYISGSIYSGLHILSSKFSGNPSEYALLEKDWLFNTEKEAIASIKIMTKQLKKLNRKYGISGN